LHQKWFKIEALLQCIVDINMMSYIIAHETFLQKSSVFTRLA